MATLIDYPPHKTSSTWLPAQHPAVAINSLEVVELEGHAAAQSLESDFGVLPAEPELALVPIERDRFEDQLRSAFAMPQRDVRRGLA
jgi:hypothetical protein